MTVSRPLLRWHGGKWLLAPWILDNMPDHRIYVEPFGGAASVLLRKRRSYSEIYNDLDQDVVNLFRVLRSDRADDLIRQVRLTPFAEAELQDAYRPAADPIDQARKLIVRSLQGFGSNGTHRKTGFRANSTRSGSTPAQVWAKYPESLSTIVDRLQGVTILSRDAKAVMREHDGPETFHFVDPPYVLSTRSDDRPDYAHEMTDADHVALLTFLRGLSGKVMLCGYDCEIYQSLLPDWRRIDRDVLADGAAKRTESLWMNWQERLLL